MTLARVSVPGASDGPIPAAPGERRGWLGVKIQQVTPDIAESLGLKGASGKMCQANPWPYPTGATDAPGAESADTVTNNEFNLQNQ